MPGVPLLCINDKEPLMPQKEWKDNRPWGEYRVLLNAPDHKVKQITVKPDCRLSLQLHHHRNEHWFIVCGDGVVTLGEQEIYVQAGSSVDIPVETAHRIQNTGKKPLVFIEVQTGDYFGEDDIVRLEDDYGRIKKEGDKS